MRSPLVGLSLLALLLAAWRAAAWAVRPKADVLGRRVRFPAASVVALLLVASAAAVPPLRTWRLEAALAVAATGTAGVGAEVRCQGLGGAFVDAGRAAGHVVERNGVMDRVVHLDRDVCRRLRSYLQKEGARPTADEVVAVHVLSHEARHVAGTRDEATAECEAVQRDATTARALGAPEQRARSLAETYWRDHYRRMPEGYVSAACGPGLPLDEALASAPWSDPGAGAARP